MLLRIPAITPRSPRAGCQDAVRPPVSLPNDNQEQTAHDERREHQARNGIATMMSSTPRTANAAVVIN